MRWSPSLPVSSTIPQVIPNTDQVQHGNYASMDMVSQTTARTTMRYSKYLGFLTIFSPSTSQMDPVTSEGLSLLLSVSATTHGTTRARVMRGMERLRLALTRSFLLADMRMRQCRLPLDARLAKLVDRVVECFGYREYAGLAKCNSRSGLN